MEFDIKKVSDENELKICLEIRRTVFIEEKNVPAEIENDEYDCLDGRSEHFLVFADKKPVGTVRMLFTDSDCVKLQRLCFLKEYRGFGLGSRTVEYLEERYRSLGKKKIFMEAKFAVSPFYEKCGYKAVSDIFYEVGIKHIKMEKEI